MNSSTATNLVKIATSVNLYLRHQNQPVLPTKLLQQFIETAFFASMKSEESRHIVCTLAFVNHKNPAGKNPLRIRPQRRSYIAFDKSIPFDIRNLVKLSQATPPWASCIAVCETENSLHICGLFDQETHYRNSLNNEEGDRFDRPGIFQLEITGIGSFTIHDDSCLIATLNQNAVVRTFHDVLHEGPVANIIKKICSKHHPTIKQLLQENHVTTPKRLWESDLIELWTRTLSRILINIKRSNHGGAVLLSPTNSVKNLKIKYKIDYPKLENIIPEHIASEARENHARALIFEDYLGEQKDEIPILLHLSESVAGNDAKDSIKGELGCVNFIASLARVDGCVLITSGLNVKGFGVEITCRNDPVNVFTAGDERASKSKLRRLDFTNFGTRHRSMMRYCYSNPGSIGFVISQDGDVRAITRLGKKLVLWENIRLQDVITAEQSITKKVSRKKIV